MKSRIIKMHLRAPLFAATLLTLCGSGCAHLYTIKSEPTEAQIELNGKNVGKTPYSFPVESLPKDQDSVIRVTKEGRAPIQAIIPGGSTAVLSSEVLLKLPEKEDDLQKLNRMTLLLWHAQKLTGLGRYPEASQISDELLSEEPKFVAAHLLKASILFLSKNASMAQEEWKKVLELDPSNGEASRALRLTDGGGSNASRSVGSVPETKKDK